LFNHRCRKLIAVVAYPAQHAHRGASKHISF
ncbi:hypothetical protein ABH944_009011, partial [Caballeronia udeis]